MSKFTYDVMPDPPHVELIYVYFDGYKIGAICGPNRMNNKKPEHQGWFYSSDDGMGPDCDFLPTLDDVKQWLESQYEWRRIG